MKHIKALGHLPAVKLLAFSIFTIASTLISLFIMMSYRPISIDLIFGCLLGFLLLASTVRALALMCKHIVLLQMVEQETLNEYRLLQACYNTDLERLSGFAEVLHHRLQRTIHDTENTKKQLENSLSMLLHAHQSVLEARTREQKTDYLFNSLFQHAEYPYLLFDEYRLIACNGASLQQFGYTSFEEVKATHPVFLSPKKQADGWPSVQKYQHIMEEARCKGLAVFQWLYHNKSEFPFNTMVVLHALEIEGRQAFMAIHVDAEQTQGTLAVSHFDE